MSDSDNPFGFGRGDRTVIRPNPAGRRPAPPSSPAPPAYPAPPDPYPQPAPPPYPGSRRRLSARRNRPIRASRNRPAISRAIRRRSRRRRTTGSSRSRAAQAPQPLSPRSSLRIDELVAPNENPIMRAAGPLLLLLGGLRVAVLRASFASLMEQVAEAIKFFENDIRSAGIPEEQARTAKYILCATADDIVQNIPTEDRHVWTQYSMLSRFFGERTGGVRFFEELDRAKMDPLGNYSVLELLHACLALGLPGHAPHVAPAARPRCSRFSATCMKCCAACGRKRPPANFAALAGAALAGRACAIAGPDLGCRPRCSASCCSALFLTLRDAACRQRRSGRRQRSGASTRHADHDRAAASSSPRRLRHRLRRRRRPTKLRNCSASAPRWRHEIKADKLDAARRQTTSSSASAMSCCSSPAGPTCATNSSRSPATSATR